MGLHEDEVVQARRDYANHLHIDLQGPTQNADWPIHIHNAANPDEPNRVNLGNAHARYELNRYYISWAHAPGHEISITSLEGLNKYFEDEVEAARLEPPEVRQEMLANAPKSPELIEVTARVFRRNPYVVAEVLEKADGKCQNPKCAKPAPFLRASDGSPYLEVHHKIPLAQGGEDTVDNAIALCPNCHREAHFGGLRFD
jgi:hypothetical protein